MTRFDVSDESVHIVSEPTLLITNPFTETGVSRIHRLEKFGKGGRWHPQLPHPASKRPKWVRHSHRNHPRSLEAQP
jgi:hypothetical protein